FAAPVSCASDSRPREITHPRSNADDFQCANVLVTLGQTAPYQQAGRSGKSALQSLPCRAVRPALRLCQSCEGCPRQLGARQSISEVIQEVWGTTRPWSALTPVLRARLSVCWQVAGAPAGLALGYFGGALPVALGQNSV